MLITPDDLAKQLLDRRVQKDELPATPDEVCSHASRSPTYRLNMSILQPPPSYSQQVEIVDKVLAHVVDLTELRRILNECVAERDAPVAGGEE